MSQDTQPIAIDCIEPAKDGPFCSMLEHRDGQPEKMAYINKIEVELADYPATGSCMLLRFWNGSENVEVLVHANKVADLIAAMVRTGMGWNQS
jgi:hypothetical protein